MAVAKNREIMRKSIVLLAAAATCLFFSLTAKAQLNVPYSTVIDNPPVYGPYNGAFLTGGDGLEKTLTENDSVLEADASWTLFAWINPSDAPTGRELVAGFGSPDDEYSRYLALAPGKLILSGGKHNSLEAAVTLAPGQWHFIAASFDGQQFHLYSDGTQVASGSLILGSVSNTLNLAPATREPGWSHFGGKIAGLTLTREALTADAISEINRKGDDFSTAVFEEGSKPWPVQTRGQAGYRAPQDPSEMPRSKAPFAAPVAIRFQSSSMTLSPTVQTTGPSPAGGPWLKHPRSRQTARPSPARISAPRPGTPPPFPEPSSPLSLIAASTPTLTTD
jgi:hypothetical protein